LSTYLVWRPNAPSDDSLPRAQERVRRVGVLMSGNEDDPQAKARFTLFAQTLAELGWVEGRNLKIDLRCPARPECA
jgi:hypothetical protein